MCVGFSRWNNTGSILYDKKKDYKMGMYTVGSLGLASQLSTAISKTQSATPWQKNFFISSSCLLSIFSLHATAKYGIVKSLKNVGMKYTM